MNTITEKLEDLNQLVISGKLLDAFDKYYHDEVEMQENENAPLKGKHANRKREEEFLSNIVEFRNAAVKGLAVSDEASFVIWSFDYTHRVWGVRNYTQVSVQTWKDDKIVKEQFFYGS
jgi:SnoaL-like protein